MRANIHSRIFLFIVWIRLIFYDDCDRMYYRNKKSKEERLKKYGSIRSARTNESISVF